MPNLTQISTVLLMTMMGLSIPISHAQTLLPAQQAFQFSIESANEQQARLSWQIQPDYYLYQHRFTVNSSKGAVKFNLPKGKAQFDENFGESIVYWNQVEFSIKTQPNQTYSVSWQGCAKDQICYAPQKKEFRTDATGRVIQDAPTLKFTTAQPSQTKSVFLSGQTSNNIALESERPAKLVDEPVTPLEKIEKKPELAKENGLNEKSAKEKAEPQSSEKNVKETAKPSNEPKALATEKKSETLATAKQAQDTATPKNTESTTKATDFKENKTLTAKAEKNVENSTTAIATTTTTETTSSPAITKAKREHQDINAQAVAQDMAQIATTTALAEQAQEMVTSTEPVQPAESKQVPSLTPTENQTSAQNISSSTSTESPVLAKDQQWLQQLQQHSFWYAVALFLGLGFLLAFTPCSLPMIPIVSSLLLRQTQGVKAWSIALVFVLSMATVYAVMGFIASSAGLGLQRWLQQPMVLVGFSVLFIVFALNLFGAFELQLPNRLVRRLDHWQSLQSGGTFISAGVMGVLSALLVGPCMTAPLAGVLLFIAQSEQQWQGAVLLFSLGFGMGIPLLLVSVLGARVLPRAGEWMNQVKAVFAFMMLGLSIYFVRPLLPEVVYAFLWYALAIAVVAYALFRFMWKHKVLKVVYSVMCVGALFGVASCHYQQYKHTTMTTTSTVATWQRVQTVDEFKQVLSNAPANRPIMIDVYADWCVACQPIEKMLKTSDVQQALKGYTLIKLDLSQFDEQHQAVLDEWQVLGPPTMLFLDAQQQEQRHLRLTGAFTQDELFKRLQP